MKKQEQIEHEISRLEETFVSPKKANPLLESISETLLAGGGASLADLLRRPAITYDILSEIDENRPPLSRRVVLTVETTIKYAGYIKRQRAEVERHIRLESKSLPDDIDYKKIKGLRIEAAQKLDKIRPANVGQASRISGVNPADITVLLIYLGMN